MEKIKNIFLENKAWAAGKLALDEHYFENMAHDQKPDYLWIGCSDSRVPPSEITGTDPGEMFVARNIANLVVPTDISLQSVIQYAVENLKVRHIIVCGHYNCGGVKAAMSHQSLGLLNNWVSNIKRTYSENFEQLSLIKVDQDRVNRLVELNVIEQVKNLKHSSVIQKSWSQEKMPYLHGWVYDLRTGLLKDLVTVNPNDEIQSAYKYDV